MEEKQLQEQLITYALVYFKWHERYEFSVSIDEKLHNNPWSNQYSILTELIEKKSRLIEKEPNWSLYLYENRNETIKKVIESSLRKVGIKNLESEFGIIEKTVDRVRELRDRILTHLDKLEFHIREHYNEERHLSKEPFKESKNAIDTISAAVNLFKKETAKAIPALEKEFGDIEEELTETSDNIFHAWKLTAERNERLLKRKHEAKVETEKGVRYINPTNLLIDSIRHNVSDIRIKMKEKHEAIRNLYTTNVFNEILKDGTAYRIKRLITTIDERDLMLKKLNQLSIKASSIPPQNALDIISSEVIIDDARIPFNPEKREELIADFLKLAKAKILSEADVLHWLRTDFQGFKPVDKPRILKAKAEKGIIIFFVRQVYMKYEKEARVMKAYRSMLKDRIQNCNNLSDEYLKAHFADKQPQKFPDLLEF